MSKTKTTTIKKKSVEKEVKEKRFNLNDIVSLMKLPGNFKKNEAISFIEDYWHQMQKVLLENQNSSISTLFGKFLLKKKQETVANIGIIGKKNPNKTETKTIPAHFVLKLKVSSKTKTVFKSIPIYQ